MAPGKKRLILRVPESAKKDPKRGLTGKIIKKKYKGPLTTLKK